MSKPFDASSKELIEIDPATWARLLVGAVPWPVPAIDADLSSVTSEADKVLRIDAPDPWLVHVEFQASHDRTLPLRLQRYNILAHARHGLPVLSLAFLLRPEADGPALDGELRHRLPDGWLYHEFRYRIVRLWQRPADEFLAAGLAALPLAPLGDLAGEPVSEVVRRVGDRLRAEAAPDVANKLWAALFLLMGLCYPEDLIESLLKGAFAMEESTTYQLLIRRGREQGRVEGKAEVRGEEARHMLLRMGRNRLGPPSEATIAAIQAIDDVARIEALGDRAFLVGSWEELLAEA